MSRNKLAQQPCWTEQIVAGHFRQAVLTLRKLPSAQLQGYSNAWPDIVRLPYEVAYMEARSIQLKATPEDIATLDKVFAWMQWIEVEERKLIWRRAEHVSWRAICWEFGMCRQTVWFKWKAALKKIAIQLNANANESKTITVNVK